MPYTWQLLSRVADERVIAIVRDSDPDSALAAARTILDAGLGVLEVSLTTPGALEVIARLRAAYPDRLIGAGTVLDAAGARSAVAAGAQLLVSPALADDVVATARRHGVLAVPGCSTPTEMLTALTAGADLIKVFPASRWRPEDISQLRVALPHLPLVPTGGIAPADAAAWIRAGAVAVGVGSALTTGGAEQAKNRVATLRTALRAAQEGSHDA
ncbi:bifunctional 4-hydroxy-2-oxoglutarate aldolase/2-dehydro-3-deoxy-phosphogluconate aldolase [Micromonospora sp. NPDC049240]|uniref:bifunctional 4-hydroxy-2-oxoglutarate aldolase/2-dehydro-3-deoxy-phosphogluconate aldolase n=1 Tax=Micromonospora sp. NPDC049240 TaxID=3155151 RepID=UPI00340099A6